MKLIGKKMDSRRIKEIRRIVTKWETTSITPELPMTADTIDIFKNGIATGAQVKVHAKLVWYETPFAQPELSKPMIVVVTKPTDLAELNLIRNKLQLIHAILGAMVWDSLTTHDQLEIIGEEEICKQGMEYD